MFKFVIDISEYESTFWLVIPYVLDDGFTFDVVFLAKVSCRFSPFLPLVELVFELEKKAFYDSFIVGSEGRIQVRE